MGVQSEPHWVERTTYVFMSNMPIVLTPAHVSQAATNISRSVSQSLAVKRAHVGRTPKCVICNENPVVDPFPLIVKDYKDDRWVGGT